MTTLPAPTTAPAPTVTPGQTITPAAFKRGHHDRRVAEMAEQRLQGRPSRVRPHERQRVELLTPGSAGETSGEQFGIIAS